ncbi:hypothetical protein F5877DRAFT_73212, partial [Lentinula edodes]
MTRSLRSASTESSYHQNSYASFKAVAKVAVPNTILSPTTAHCVNFCKQSDANASSMLMRNMFPPTPQSCPPYEPSNSQMLWRSGLLRRRRITENRALATWIGLMMIQSKLTMENPGIVFDEHELLRTLIYQLTKSFQLVNPPTPTGSHIPEIQIMNVPPPCKDYFYYASDWPYNGSKTSPSSGTSALVVSNGLEQTVFRNADIHVLHLLGHNLCVSNIAYARWLSHLLSNLPAFLDDRLEERRTVVIPNSPQSQLPIYVWTSIGVPPYATYPQNLHAPESSLVSHRRTLAGSLYASGPSETRLVMINLSPVFVHHMSILHVCIVNKPITDIRTQAGLNRLVPKCSVELYSYFLVSRFHSIRTIWVHHLPPSSPNSQPQMGIWTAEDSLLLYLSNKANNTTDQEYDIFSAVELNAETWPGIVEPDSHKPSRKWERVFTSSDLASLISQASFDETPSTSQSTSPEPYFVPADSPDGPETGWRFSTSLESLVSIPDPPLKFNKPSGSSEANSSSSPTDAGPRSQFQFPSRADTTIPRVSSRIRLSSWFRKKVKRRTVNILSSFKRSSSSLSCYDDDFVLDITGSKPITLPPLLVLGRSAEKSFEKKALVWSDGTPGEAAENKGKFDEVCGTEGESVVTVRFEWNDCRSSSEMDTTSNDLIEWASSVGIDASPSLLEIYRKKCLQFSRHLSKKYQILPSSMILREIEREGQNPVGGGGFAVTSLKDIWRGAVNNQS